MYLVVFRDLVSDFLGNTQTQDYTKIDQKLLGSFKMHNRNMAILLTSLKTLVQPVLSKVYDFAKI